MHVSIEYAHWLSVFLIVKLAGAILASVEVSITLYEKLWTEKKQTVVLIDRGPEVGTAGTVGAGQNTFGWTK